MKEVIDTIKEKLEESATTLVINWEKGKYIQKENAFKIVEEIIGEYINDADRWIPVQERLPENGTKVITCDIYGNMHVMTHYDGYQYPFGIHPEHSSYYMPVVWRAFPKPYKEEKK